MSKYLWLLAEEEVRDEMWEEYACEDDGLDEEELMERVEIRYQDKLEDQCERAEQVHRCQAGI